VNVAILIVSNLPRKTNSSAGAAQQERVQQQN